MARYIDAELALKLHDGELWAWDVPDLKEFLAEVPTADVAPRAEVAREIFEEIERNIVNLETPYQILHCIPQDYITALKKKYTEGK